jgi:alkanesulfonate monooxygenase SsuD/methylene tetrahydromethanopterin reductase-like flavin-dependent oxidoreductase (luciferase family)
VRGLAEPFGPAAVRGRIPLLMGGSPELAARRAAAWDAGYTVGGAPPEMVAEMIPAFRAAYERHGGRGTPRIVCLSYFSIGEEHTEESLHNLRSYYAAMGDWAEAAAQGAARGEQGVVERARAFEEVGADELIFDPTVNDLGQVDRLADVVL